ncbi:hypothetical protein OK016_09475 [Vibrio chagasii]|nr:hypothetical protein [Vibrio chagasii]
MASNPLFVYSDLDLNYRLSNDENYTSIKTKQAHTGVTMQDIGITLGTHDV